MTTALDEKLAAATRHIVVGWSAISVDIETNPADGNRIFKIGAVRSDSDGVVSLSTGRLDPADVGRRINAVSAGAKLLVGHNLRRHDLPQPRLQYPGLACLDLPILDTLELSAIAFPSNPYHRLVKGYKLISDSRNDPVKDARRALDLASEEVDAQPSDTKRRPHTVSHARASPDKLRNRHASRLAALTERGGPCHHLWMLCLPRASRRSRDD